MIYVFFRILTLKPGPKTRIKEFQKFLTFLGDLIYDQEKFLEKRLLFTKLSWDVDLKPQFSPYARQCRWNNPNAKSPQWVVSPRALLAINREMMGGKLTWTAWRLLQLVTVTGSKWQMPLRGFAVHYYVLFLVLGNSLLCNFFTIRPLYPSFPTGQYGPIFSVNPCYECLSRSIGTDLRYFQSL